MKVRELKFEFVALRERVAELESLVDELHGEVQDAYEQSFDELVPIVSSLFRLRKLTDKEQQEFEQLLSDAVDSDYDDLSCKAFNDFAQQFKID